MENSSSNGSVEEWTCEGRQSISAEELLIKIQNGSPSLKATMYIPIPFLIIIYFLYIDLVIFHIRNCKDWKRTSCTMWVISVHVVLSTSAFACLYTPRASSIISFGRNFFFAVVLKKYFNLILIYYGGKKKMEMALKGDSVVPQNYFPCCFVCCCRNQPMTVSRIKKIQMTVHQVVFVYPTFYFVLIYLAIEGVTTSSIAGQVGSLIIRTLVVCSGLVCLYGFTIIGKSSYYALQDFFIRGKYLSVSLLVACNTLQSLIIRFIGILGGIPCGFPYPDPDVANLYHNFILFFEVFLLSILGWFSFKRLDIDCKVKLKPAPQSDFTTIHIGDDKTPNGENHPDANGNGVHLSENFHKNYLPREMKV